MGDVIRIYLCEDLPTDAQNKLRVRMEEARWRERWRRAKAENDYDTMDRLQREWEMLGLP